MTGPVIPAELWPDGAVALVWSAFGFGKWIAANDYAGTWQVERADMPMPEGWDWRVPVMRQPAIDLEQFRRFIHACGYGAGAFPERKSEADRLLALIDGQANVRSSSEHSSELATDLVTDDAVRRLVRAMENTPGDDLIEPNTRLCRRLLVAALKPSKGEVK